jgi:cysteine desulfuration protein SufE
MSDAAMAASASMFPIEATAAQAQAAIAEEFSFFGDWSERYQYLIDLGRKLPPFPEQWKVEEHRLHGCQSMVWIVASGDASRLDFAATSDSAIVSGLVFLALRVYSGRPAAEILAAEPDYVAGAHASAERARSRMKASSAARPLLRDGDRCFARPIADT